MSSQTIRLDGTDFVGKLQESYSIAIAAFLGIPYGSAARYEEAKPAYPYTQTGQVNASSFGPSCVQQSAGGSFAPPEFLLASPQSMGTLGASLQILVPQGEFKEDALSINVFKPAEADSNASLPVVVWIHGGGFYFGGSATYDGSAIVSRSVELKQPIIFVSMNYRLGAFGFLGSEEIKKAGVSNLGMKDQRLCLKWVNKYISKFGGNPNQVTLWGESAGAMCAFMHTLMYDGKTDGLFHGVFLQSGTYNPVGDVTIRQGEYDALVKRAGGEGATDTLDYIKKLPFDKFMAAVDQTPIALATHRTLNLLWQPRVDGDLFSDTPQNLIRQGKMADIPVINGALEDEGTLFALPLVDIKDDAGVKEFLRDFCYLGSNDVDITPLAALYPEDPSHGAPYDTGTANAGTPIFKRLAALQGDYGFHAQRRFFFNNRTQKSPAWSYLSKRNKSVPYLGSCHGTDLNEFFDRCVLQDYLIHFVHGKDPNSGSSLPKWPAYDAKSKIMLNVLEEGPPTTCIDTFREEQLDLVNRLAETYPM